MPTNMVSYPGRTTNNPGRTFLQHIRSPLMRIGYGLQRENAALLILHAGQVVLISGKPDVADMEISGPRVIWLPPDDAREIKAGSGARGTLLSIRDTVIIQALPASPLGQQMRRALEQRLSLPLEETRTLDQILDGLFSEQTESPAGTEVAQDLYLALLLLQVWRMLRTEIVVHGRAPQGLAERFIALAGQHLREHWSVNKYAATLKVSRHRLGTTVQRATGLSPRAFLHQALVREASQLLANTGMPVGQIAFRLGFSDPAYFNRFFSMKAGLSPGKFRRRARVSRTKADKSYAAWP